MRIDKLEIREFSEEDVKKRHRDFLKSFYAGFESVLGEEGLDQLLDSREIGRSREFGLYRENTLVGRIDFKELDEGTPEISIELDENMQGKGYGYKCLRYLIDKIEKEETIEYFVYVLFKSNTASKKLVEKLGGILDKDVDLIENEGYLRYKIYPQKAR